MSKRIALTFDDGPSRWTEGVLDVLKTHEVPATFFICGVKVREMKHKKLLRRMRDEGHEIGNHTMTHRPLPTLTNRDTLEELADCSAVIHGATGIIPSLYRAPYLRNTMVAKAAAAACGMSHVEADVIGYDWEEGNPEKVIDNLWGDSYDGGIVLLHDGRPPFQPSHEEGGSLDTRVHTISALSGILPLWLAGDYEIVPVRELMAVVA